MYNSISRLVRPFMSLWVALQLESVLREGGLVPLPTSLLVVYKRFVFSKCFSFENNAKGSFLSFLKGKWIAKKIAEDSRFGNNEIRQ